MLIEAQAQKLLAEQLKAKIDGEDKKEPLALMDVDEPETKDSLKEEVSDIEMKDADEKPPEEPAEKDESDDKSIDIDPKTFCKLGHFHLLLEDYAKGKIQFLLETFNRDKCIRVHSSVRLSEIPQPSSRSLERHSVPLWIRNRLSTF